MGVVDTPFFIRNGFGYDRGFDDFVWVRARATTRGRTRGPTRGRWRVRRQDGRPHDDAGGALARAAPRRAVLPLRRHLGPARALGRARVLHQEVQEGYEGEQIYPAYGNWKKAGPAWDDVDLGHATTAAKVTMVDFWIGRLLSKLDALGLREHARLLHPDHGFYWGARLLGKAEWVHDPEASVTADSSVPEWLTDSWLLTVERSPPHRELTNVPLMVRGPVSSRAAPRR